MSSSSSTSERGAKPPDFTGKREDTLAFVRLTENFVRMNPTRYPDDETKCGLFLSLCKGALAIPWADQRLGEIGAWYDKQAESSSTAADDEEDDALYVDEDEFEPRKPDFKKLVSDFKKAFAPIDRRGAAQAALETLRMTGDFATIDQLIMEFEKHSIVSGLNDDALLIFFKKGLPRALVDKVSSTYPLPADLEEYKTRAVELQNAWLQRRAEDARWNRPARVPFRPAVTPAASTPVTVSVRPSPAVNAVHTAPGARSFSSPIPKLTPDEKQRLVNAGACFRWCMLSLQDTWPAPARSSLLDLVLLFRFNALPLHLFVQHRLLFPRHRLPL